MAKQKASELWRKRWASAQMMKETWERDQRVNDCYNYWRGEQLKDPKDEFGNRRAQINKIHPEVRNSIPSLYYYRPFARIRPTPEAANDAGTMVDDDTQMLQDTANYLIRNKASGYRDNTFLALKEAHWAYGVCEVGYSAEFVDTPTAERPALKEKEETPSLKPAEPEKVGGDLLSPLGHEGTTLPPTQEQAPPEPGMDTLGLSVDENSDLESIEAEVKRLQGQLKRERFFVKHIPAKQVMVSTTDLPILEANDWVGYYEDMPLEDVKTSEAYSNTAKLEPNTEGWQMGGNEQRIMKQEELEADTDKIRLYKIWDFRTHTKWVFASGGEKPLLKKAFKRCPLKFLRFDVDPYHFYPRPLIVNKLDSQDMYNQGREYMRRELNSRVARYTYDEGAIDAIQLQKLESGEMGTFVPRHSGTDGTTIIAPINQPNFSADVMPLLGLTDKEFQDVGGVGGDARVAQSKTATQAKIGEVKNQAQDSFDRILVSEWLADVADELLRLAIEKMNLDTWVAINVVPDSPFSQDLSAMVQQQFQRINANILSSKTAGVEWEVCIDIESLSPVSEEEQFQKWMTGLGLFGNPVLARMFSVSPPILKRTLDLLGVKSAKDQGLILQGMQQVVQMEQQLAAQSQNAQPGMSPQAGGGAPGAPKPPGPPPGGPQPGGPAGPGASVPKPPMPQ